MFSYFKAKGMKVRYEALLLKKLYNFVESIPDIKELALKAKDMDINEIQKLIVETLVDYTMSKEDTVESE